MARKWGMATVSTSVFPTSRLPSPRHIMTVEGVHDVSIRLSLWGGTRPSRFDVRAEQAADAYSNAHAHAYHSDSRLNDRESQPEPVSHDSVDKPIGHGPDPADLSI